MATQPTSDAPFGLQPNIAAGLSYLFIPIVALIMLFAGNGTNKFVKWHAAQACGLFVAAIVLWVAVIVLGILFAMIHLGFLSIIFMLLWLAIFVEWLWAIIGAFTGKEVRLPVVADITQALFKSML